MRPAPLPALRPGDVVAIRLDPGPEWRSLVHAVWDAGAAILPVDHRLTPSDARALMARARPTVVVEGPTAARSRGGVPADPSVALVVATSGTAALPRLVELSRSAVDAAVAASALAIAAGADDPWLCCLPLGHVGGLLVLMRSVLLGSPVAIHARFDPAAVSESGARFASLVPTMLHRLLDAGVELRRYRAVLVGGGPIDAELRRRAERSGPRIIETYGLTESCGGVVYDGRPLSGVGVRTAEDDAVELAGPTVMRGYRFDPEATSAAFTDDGWLRTRDAGAIDASGRLRIRGRMDDVIVSGGEKVWPEDVERVLRGHPGIADVAVAGRPDPEWGSRVVAFVVPADGARPPTLEDLRAFAGRELARHCAPREVRTLERLPRTALGKLRRSALP
jgi:o-succinylbenzoate---CoA ligase